MGKLTPDALVGDLNNALGPMVFYKRTFGTSSRARVTPSNGVTPARATVRARLSSIAAAWQSSLTPANRSAWILATKSQSRPRRRLHPRRLSGWQYFHQVNLTRLNLGLAILAAPPSPQDPDPLTSLEIDTLDATNQVISLNPSGATGSNSYIIVYGTDQMPTTRYPRNGWYRQLAVFAPGASRPFDISTAWTSKFGTLDGSQRVGFMARPANAIDGFLGWPVKAYATSTGSSALSSLIGVITPTPLVPPVLADLSWANQGIATATQQTAGPLIMRATPSALNQSQNHLLTKAVPAATPWKAIIGVIPGILLQSGICGLVLFDGSSKIVTFEFQAGGSGFPSLNVAHRTLTTYSSAPFIMRIGLSACQIIWLQVEDDGTNYTFSFLPDGNEPITLFSESRTAWLSAPASQVGLLLDQWQYSTPLIEHSASFIHFSLS